jgi:uncharacterized lipoprotein YmbA
MRTRPFVALAVLELVLGGCVSLKRTPEARFFVLRSVVEPSSPTAETAEVVGVLRVRLPGHLERPQLVTWRAPTELRIDEFLRWAEPLDAAVGRTLAENLDALLPSHRVIRSPWPSGAKLRCRVAVGLRLFGLQDNGEVRLEGRWALLPAASERPYATDTVSLRRGPLAAGAAGSDPGAGVEAMSELLGDLSRQIAAAVSKLPEEEGAKK